MAENPRSGRREEDYAATDTVPLPERAQPVPAPHRFVPNYEGREYDEGDFDREREAHERGLAEAAGLDEMPGEEARLTETPQEAELHEAGELPQAYAEPGDGVASGFEAADATVYIPEAGDAGSGGHG